MAQEQYRGPKAADVMPAALPGPAGLPPSDAPMLFTGDDPEAARKLMAAMWARAAPITDAVAAAYAAAQAGGSPAPASTEGQSIASEAEFVEATGALARGLFQFDLAMGGWAGWWVGVWGGWVVAMVRWRHAAPWLLFLDASCTAALVCWPASSAQTWLLAAGGSSGVEP